MTKTIEYKPGYFWSITSGESNKETTIHIEGSNEVVYLPNKGLFY